MILLSLDFETTGLDREQDEVIEVGAILYSTGQRKCLESAGYLVKPTAKTISKEITELTGVHPVAVEKFGFSAQQGLDNIIELAKQADAIIGQNVVRFDKHFLDNWCKRERKPIIDKLYIDTRTDLPGVKGQTLMLMLAEVGVINLFPHSALADAQSVLVLLERHSRFNKFDLPADKYIDKTVELAKSPIVVLKGMQDRGDNTLAKKQKFSWNPDYKIWWKTVKECQVAEEIAACPFNVSKAGPEVLVEKLWYS